VGLQAKAETHVGATRLKLVVFKVPFRAAVMVALWFVVKVPAVVMKVPEPAPADTITDAGTEREALLSDSVTVVSAEATWLKLTVQEVEAPEVSVFALQLREVRLIGSTPVVIEPPVAVV
jgi:hypothetical protein